MARYFVLAVVVYMPLEPAFDTVGDCLYFAVVVRCAGAAKVQG